MRPPSEAQDSPEATSGANLPAPAPDPRLSLPAQRLAGSDHCLNCGTALQGPFCHYCGQPDKNLMRFFPALMRELLEDFLDFDSRFMRTLKPLLFRPGKLTRDYLDGRRFRYVPPLRLYVFSSLAFFFIAAFLTSDSIELKTGFQEGAGAGFRIELDEADRAEFDAAMAQLSQTHPVIAEEITRSVEDGPPGSENADTPPDEAAGAEAEFPEKPDFEVNGKPWDRETNPLELALMPGWVNDWINDEIAESPKKGKAIADNPNLFTDKIFDVLPATMFVLLPLVALLLKFWYLFARKYYVEHLIFALHNHAFIFTSIVILLLAGALVDWREPGGEGPLSTAHAILQGLILAWIPLYLLISLKRVYRQGWGLTLLKYAAIGSSYAVLLGFATVVVALLGFVLL